MGQRARCQLNNPEITIWFVMATHIVKNGIKQEKHGSLTSVPSYGLTLGHGKTSSGYRPSFVVQVL